MMEECNKTNLAELPRQPQPHSPIPPPKSTDIYASAVQPHLKSSKITPEEGNFHPPSQAQPALDNPPTTNPSLPHVVLIEDNVAAARDKHAIIEPAMSLPDQNNAKEEEKIEAQHLKEEIHNNADEQQQQQQQQPSSSHKQEEAELTTTVNTAANNNNNPTALSIAAAGTAPTPEDTDAPSAAQQHHELEELEADQHEDGHRPKLHHLTRHWLPPEDRGISAIEHMGASSVKEAEQKIRGMSQKELRASFQKVYGTPTSSFNNNWLRRKLYEAVGATGTASTKRYRRVGRNDAAARKRELQRVAAAEAEAEAVEALAEIAAGPSMGGSDVPAESSSR